MRNLNSTDKEIRKFGLIALVLFGGLCAAALWQQKPAMTWFLGTLAFLGVCFLALPGPFRPVYRAWMKVAHRVGTFFTTLVLTLAYFGVITPAALLKSVFGGKPLPLKPDPAAETYWVTRREGAQPRERFYLRY